MIYKLDIQSGLTGVALLTRSDIAVVDVVSRGDWSPTRLSATQHMHRKAQASAGARDFEMYFPKSERS